MLCEKNLDLAMLKKMFSAFNSIEDKETEEKATKEIGEVAAMQFIPAVRNERKRTRND
jgi:hypothetical protein